MEEWKVLLFLKADILPPHLKDIILPLDSLDEAFRMIDSHFSFPYSEIARIKHHIIGQAPLPDELVRSDYRWARMRHIQKYLILWIKHTEPYEYTEPLSMHDISMSLMTWIPSCEYTSLLLQHTETIISMSANDSISYAQSYLNLITDKAILNDYLQSCRDSFKQKELCHLCMPIQNQNQELKPICKQKQIISCLLCNKKHHIHKCPKLYQLRDSIINKPDELCLTHCGHKTNKSLEGECHLYHNRNGKIFNLTCQGKDAHGNLHFLLCPEPSCTQRSNKVFFPKGKYGPKIKIEVIED